MGRVPKQKPAPKKRPLPKLPKKTPAPKIDLEPAQKAVNEAAARVRGLWLGYIALLAYLFIAVGAVTHRDLLLEAPVKLPALNVELPLIGFFAVAPIFLLINHFYLLLQLLGLGRRICEFNDEIAKTGLSEEARRRERRKLDTFVIVQMLGGTREERQQLTGKFFSAIALITIVIAPVALLLTIQLQFLPYQYELVTWMHRTAIGVDLALLWTFWPSIRLGDWAPWRGTPVRSMAVSMVMLFACVIATFPGEVADSGMGRQDWKKPEDSYLSSIKGWLFGDLTRGVTRKRRIPFSRALDLPDNKTLIDLDKFDKIRRRHRDNKDQLKPWQTGRTLSLRGQNLRGAMFDRADLRNVDLFNAGLQGASLDYASLQGASLVNAGLQGASLDSTFLWRAYGEPDRKNLAGVWVKEPQLQALTAEQLVELETNALASVENDDVKQRIKKALARLSVPEEDVQDSLPENYWTALAGKLSEADHRKDLAKRLKALACDEKNAPYVAQGLILTTGFEELGILSRLEEIGDSHLPGVARTLLDAAEGRTIICPGVKGLDAGSIANLRKWTAKTGNGKQDEADGETGR